MITTDPFPTAHQVFIKAVPPQRMGASIATSCILVRLCARAKEEYSKTPADASSFGYGWLELQLSQQLRSDRHVGYAIKLRLPSNAGEGLL